MIGGEQVVSKWKEKAFPQTTCVPRRHVQEIPDKSRKNPEKIPTIPRKPKKKSKNPSTSTQVVLQVVFQKEMSKKPFP